MHSSEGCTIAGGSTREGGVIGAVPNFERDIVRDGSNLGVRGGKNEMDGFEKRSLRLRKHGTDTKVFEFANPEEFGFVKPQFAVQEERSRGTALASKKNSKKNSNMVLTNADRGVQNAVAGKSIQHDERSIFTIDTDWEHNAIIGLERQCNEYGSGRKIDELKLNTGFTPFLEPRKLKTSGKASNVCSLLNQPEDTRITEVTHNRPNDQAAVHDNVNCSRNRGVLIGHNANARLVSDLIEARSLGGIGRSDPLVLGTAAVDDAKNGATGVQSSLVKLTVLVGDLDTAGVLVPGKQSEKTKKPRLAGALARLQTGERHSGGVVKRRSRRSKPLKVFWLFGRLPVELRHIIWRFASRQPQRVQVETSKKYRIFKPRRHKVPGILHANAESRQVASSIFQQMFRSTGMVSGYIFFNSHIDTLCMDVESARRIAAITDGDYDAQDIVLDRKSVAHLDVQFSLSWDHPAMTGAISELICTGIHKAWPGLQSFSFPGLVSHGEFPFSTLHMNVKRPSTLEAGFAAIQELTVRIRKAYSEECARLGETRTDLGLMIEYF